MAARVTNMMREKMAREFESERLERAMKRDKSEYVDVAFEWHTKQTAKAILFPTYGWVPKVAIRWRKADGLVVTSGREGDQMMIAKWLLDKKGGA